MSELVLKQKVIGAYNRISEKKFIFSEDQLRDAEKLAQEVDSKFDMKAEREMVMKAMNLSGGHFFKCPNDHIYAIGECGGAMEESKCHECGAKIGGGDHNLISGNTLATEMGGQRPAWDPQGFDA